MRGRLCMGILAAALWGAAPAARADVWDLGSDSDNDIGSDTEIVHGLDQVHDLAAQQGGTVEDVDFYRFQMPGATSWEFLVDSMTGDVANVGVLPAFDILESDGVTVNTAGSALSSFGVARYARIPHVGPVSFELQMFVRVGSPVCALACTAADQYRIRAYETTVYVPRYNNAAGQLTVLVLQNNGDTPADPSIYAFDASGAVLGVVLHQILPPFAVRTFNLATIQGGVLNNTAGGLRIVHRAGYGQITGKAVALEPATGFTFDTPLQYRPH